MLLVVCSVIYPPASLCSSITYNASDEGRLWHHLFVDHNSYIIPRDNSSVPIYVSVQPYFLDFYGIDVKSQTYTARIFLELRWIDRLLRWDSKRYSGVERVNVPYDLIWTPDIYINGTVGQLTDIGKKSTTVIVYHNGSVVFWPFKVYTITCVVNIRQYPFDEQRCNLDVSSWTLDDRYMRIVIGYPKINLVMFTPCGDWTLECEKAYCHTEHPVGDYGFSHTIFPFRIRRKWQFVILNTFFPTMCTSLLTILCFCLPTETGERVGLSMSIFLTLAVFMTVASGDLPETANGVSLIGSYIALQLAYSGIIIVLTIMTLAIACKKDNQPFPKWLQKITRISIGHGAVGWNECGAVLDRNFSKTSREYSETNPTMNDYREGKGKPEASQEGIYDVTWDDIASMFNRICFYGSVVWQLILHLWFLSRSCQ